MSFPAVYNFGGLRPTDLELWVDNGHIGPTLMCGCAVLAVWATHTPRNMHYTSHTCSPRPQGVNRHLSLPYAGPVSLDTTHIRMGAAGGQEPNKAR